MIQPASPARRARPILVAPVALAAAVALGGCAGPAPRPAQQVVPAGATWRTEVAGTAAAATANPSAAGATTSAGAVATAKAGSIVDAASRATADPTANAAADARWWQAFNDPALTALVEAATARNADVRLALERVAAARAADVATASRLLPNVNAALGASQTRTGAPAPVKQAGLPDTLGVRGTLEVGWELDLFGAAGAASRAAGHDAAAALMTVDAARLLAATETARQYVAWQSATLRHQGLREMVRLQQAQLQLLKSRQREGVASAFDLSRAEADLADLRALADAPQPAATLAEARLATLLHLPAGTRPALPAAAQLAAVTLAPPVAPGQPLELLSRRPDLRAAEQALLAEGERLEEARANLWPRLLFGASLGRQDLQLNALHLAPSLYRNLAASFTMPLVNAGRLQALREAQAARQRAAVLTYEKTALTAVADVEASLAQCAQAQGRLAEHQAVLDERERQLAMTDALLREGQVDRLQRLDMERAVLAARLQLTDSRATLSLARIQLHAAMGGGWQLESRPQ